MHTLFYHMVRLKPQLPFQPAIAFVDFYTTMVRLKHHHHHPNRLRLNHFYTTMVRLKHKLRLFIITLPCLLLQVWLVAISTCLSFSNRASRMPLAMLSGSAWFSLLKSIVNSTLPLKTELKGFWLLILLAVCSQYSCLMKSFQAW